MRKKEMKKKFNTKAKLFGLALLAAGATVSIPAVIPAQATAAEAAAETNTVSETEKKTVTRTVRFYYKNDNGKTTPVKSSNGGDFVRTASATFERTVIKDKKTGKVISAPAWGTAKLDGFDVPVINGFTPNKKTIPAVTVSPDKLPEDISVYYTENPEHKTTLSTESKTVSRKITYYRINDDGSTSQTWSKTQSATFTRSVTTDGNGKKTYGAWAEHTFAAEDVASMDGYTHDIKTIPAVTFTPDNPPADVKVYFKKGTSSSGGNASGGQDKVKAAIPVKFTDGLGNILKSDLIDVGKKAIAPVIPTREGYTFNGWDKAFDDIQEAITVNAKWVKNAVQTLTEKKHVERKIYYYYSDGSKVIDVNGKHAVATQTADFTRYNTKDTVTGKITYGKWASVTWDKMKVMTVTGYTPNISEIAAVTFTPDNVPKDIKVYYTKNASASISTPSKYTGLQYDDGQWNYYTNGKKDKSYTGLTYCNNAWWYVSNGKLDKSFTGLSYCNNAWWYVSNGKLDKSYTGLAYHNNAWWYMSNGKLNKSFVGLVSKNNALWYIKNGTIDKSYKGTFKYNGKTYNILNGKATIKK